MSETLSKQEWAVMEALWNHSPLFLSQLMEEMTGKVDWNSSSYLTYLKRMTEKGYIGFKTISGNRCYFPVIRREDCIESERDYILSKLSDSSARLLLVSMIEKYGLSQKDKDELSGLIAKLCEDAERKK
jgi:BlaI family penicillinase repressor